LKKDFKDHCSDLGGEQPQTAEFDREAILGSLRKSALFGDKDGKWTYSEWPKLD